MSAIVERIAVDQRSALKAGDKMRLSTLRLALSDLKNRRIELGRDLTDEDALEVLTRAQKQRREAEEQYRKGGRQELAEREAAEAAILQEYLPEPLDDSGLDRLIEAAIAATGATDVKEMGKVMGRLMPEVRGRADGAVVSARVKERLGGG
ncbi:MAG TPA: GatB/YqeY domain-containing protein [Gemmatimonadota bacterium]|nr:GatB/YqeY domain-containing protein [Gemmatimonadota bacterium]